MRSLPLPTDRGVRFCFGCETEYCGGSLLGLAKQSFGLFDFIVIPVNHFHMLGFVRPASVNTPALAAELMLARLAELLEMDLPWHKIGIAHFTCELVFTEGRASKVFDNMPDGRLFDIFQAFARKGAGIEINKSDFRGEDRQLSESLLRPYRLAKTAGCRFYFASDAHSVDQLRIRQKLETVAASLGLREKDIYRIP